MGASASPPPSPLEGTRPPCLWPGWGRCYESTEFDIDCARDPPWRREKGVPWKWLRLDWFVA